MKFNFECEEIDGLVLIDEKYLCEIKDELLYAMDIFLDYYGKSELIYDFPDEKWELVRKRETIALEEFCNTGKMILFLTNETEMNCEIHFSTKRVETNTFLNVASGKLILVSASELIQCLAYPDLEMEKILEIYDLERGMYAIENDGIKKITCVKCDTDKSIFNNVIDVIDF